MYLIFSSNQRLCLSHGLFPCGIPTNILYAFLISYRRFTCPAALLLLGLIIVTILGEEKTSYEVLHYIITSTFVQFTPFGIQIFFSAFRPDYQL